MVLFRFISHFHDTFVQYVILFLGGPISPLPCTSPTGTDAEGVDTGSTEAPRELEISDGVSAS